MNEEQLNTNIEPVSTPEATVPTEEPAPVTTEAPIETPVESAPVAETPIEATPAPAETTTAPVESAPVTEAPTEVAAPAETTTPEAAPTETPEAPIGETNETITPVALDAPADPTAKKSKKGLFITIGIIVALIIICVIIFCVTQFTTANKKLTTITNKIFDYTNFNSVQKVMDKESGSYKFSASAGIKNGNEDLISGSIDFHGNYGINTTDKNAYFGLDVQNIIINKQSFIDSNDIKVDGEIDKDTAYVSIKDLYDKTIKIKNDQVKEFIDVFMDSVNAQSGSKDINIEKIKGSINASINIALEQLEKTQTVKKVDSLGLTNVITIELNKATQEKFMKAFYTALASSDIPSELAKSGIKTADEIKEMINDVTSKYEADDSVEATVSIYTAMFKKEFYGLSYTVKQEENACSKENKVFNIIKKDDTYKISYDSPFEKTIRLDLTISSTNNSISYTLKGDIKTPTALRNYDDAGNLTTCETKKEDVIKIDMTITNKSSENESSISFNTVDTITIACEKDDKDCEESTATIEADIVSSKTIDASYNESSIDKDKTTNFDDLSEEDMANIMNNVMTKYPTLSGILAFIIGDGDIEETEMPELIA